MISSIRHKQSISWTSFSNDAMAMSGKEMRKNHTDKERFAATSSCIQTRILTLFFLRKQRRSSSSLIISHRALGTVASRILKSLIERSKPTSEDDKVWMSIPANTYLPTFTTTDKHYLLPPGAFYSQKYNSCTPCVPMFDTCVSFTLFSRTLDPLVIKTGSKQVNNTNFAFLII